MLRHGSMLGGKRLRPALLLLAARLFADPNDGHITLAAVVEMIHTATFIHDDILDEADKRRYLATCNAIWDNEAAVLLGDYLFTHAFYLASTTESALACRIIGEATNTVCEGELRQVRSRGDFDLSEETYFHIIEAKTARLCECSCRLGAEYAGASADEVQRLAAYGKHLGIAFQITDDLLDVLGDPGTTGKSLGTDLEKQKLTLPLIRALQLADATQRNEIIDILTASGERKLPESGPRQINGVAPCDSSMRDQLLPYLERFNAIHYAREAAAHHADLAQQQLAGLPNSDARDILAGLPAFVLARSA
jgi:octaprenyl-diphosphate synthase